ncbi:MAG: response regulator transcription factor [Bacilli bacterium]|nr:response regulator transcription factor [Bacilli bacterium]
MKILIVDDEILIRNVIKEYLLIEKYEVFEAENGIEALNIINNNKIDLVILDIMMPKMDGYETLSIIRKNKNIPVIILSARKEEYDKLSSFEIGADDFVTKPFSPKELIARIKAILKRTKKEEKTFEYKNLKLDFLGRVLKINNNEINITPKEYELLTYFIDNKSIALSREQLLNSVWGYDFYGDDRTVDTHIKMLRHNLGEYRNLIKTVRGMGYKFEIEE